MNPSRLATALLQQDREPLLPDEGFSRRVMRDLPRDPRRSARRRWVNAAALAAGAAATALWAPLPGGTPTGVGGTTPMLVSFIFAGLLAGASACVIWAYVAAAFHGSHPE